MFLSKRSVLLLEDTVWVYGTAAAVNGNGFVINMADVLRQGYAAQRWTARAVNFCSTTYRLAETKLLYPRDLFRDMQASVNVLRSLNQPDSFVPTILKYLNEFMLCTFPGDDALKKG